MDKPLYSFDATRDLDAMVRSAAVANLDFYSRLEHLIFEEGANPHAPGIGARAILKHEQGWSAVSIFLEAGVNPRWILSDLEGFLQEDEITFDQFRANKDRLFDATRRFTDREQQSIASRTVFGSPVEINASTDGSGVTRIDKIIDERRNAREAYAETIQIRNEPGNAGYKILPAPAYDNEATRELEILLAADFAGSRLHTEMREMIEKKGANPHAHCLAARHLVNAEYCQIHLLLHYGVNPEWVLVDLRFMERTREIASPKLQKASDRLFEAVLKFTVETQEEIAGRTLFGTPAEIRRMQRPGDCFMQYAGDSSKRASIFELREAANKEYYAWKAAANRAIATSSEPPPSETGSVRPAAVRSKGPKPEGSTL